MEGSYQRDQKTIGGLDFFDELTNLQIFCRSKWKVCFSDAANGPTPGSANQAVQCAGSLQRWADWEVAHSAFFPSASRTFPEVLVLLLWNDICLSNSHCRVALELGSTSLESPGVWKWRVLPFPVTDTVMSWLGRTPPVTFWVTKPRWHLWMFHVLVPLSEAGLIYGLSLAWCNIKVCLNC